MPYRNTLFSNGNYYHIFNRGIDKRLIFKQKKDYLRFLDCLKYYQYNSKKPKFSQRHKYKSLVLNKNKILVEIVAFCLMPNHFHLLVKQVEERGIQEFMTKLSNSHSSYFNIKHKREGDLFESEFKAVLIESDEQLLHLSRYIHLNPFVANLVEKPELYPWSSCQEYFTDMNGLCHKNIVLNSFKKTTYQNFVMDHAGYAKQLHLIKHISFE